MAKRLEFADRVALVTGAGNGLGRAHALLLASRGAKVVVNDLGGSATGEGNNSVAADAVVAEIKEAGGEAVANYDSVVDGHRLVESAMDNYGRLDILINNAGILRDKTFAKMTQADWDLIYQVHVLGAFRTTHAAWPHMREAQYGRIIFTSSAAGIYGNFGQANYSMAKLGLVGFANTLALEGLRRNITANTIAPLAGSRMTETILPPELIDALRPEYVSCLVAWLCHEKCTDTGGLFEVGGGFFGKLRWERAAGKMVRIGRDITPEDIRKSWKAIAGFDSTTHPADVNTSMQPIMANIQKGKSLGGNKYIDLDLAHGYEFPDMTTSYDERDVALYALGVGAGSDPTDPNELQLVYEMSSDGFKVLPTFGVVPAINTMLIRAKKGETAPGMSYGMDRLLHGEQYTELKRPLPRKATLTHKSRVTDIWDKGKNAIIVTETRSFDEDGEELVVNRFKAVIRGAGGWGGERGPQVEENVAPEREPDATTRQTIGTGQALVYRLSGDWNPLHVDPRMAKAFGFERPILHGLCTYGYAARHVITAFCGGDPRYFKSISVRFAGSVFPGETLQTDMWKESDTRILFRCRVEDRDADVISRAAIELYDEIPKKKKPPARQPTPTAEAQPESAEPQSCDVFGAIGQYIADNPDLVGQVGVTYVFDLKSPPSAWTVDLKNGAGSVTQGRSKAECTLELSDSDFMDMCTGKADAQKLYFGGQLKISGNVMASQKLEFLRKLEPATVVAIAKARAGGGGESSAPAGPQSAGMFQALGAYIAQNPDLVGQVGHVFRFELKEPESVWTLDLKTAPGGATPGAGAKADCTLALSEADFLAMSTGKADPQQLYFGGQLKITGNVMASQKLDFISKLDPEAVKAAMASAPAAAPVASTTPTPQREAEAPKIFGTLASKLTENPALAGDIGAQIQFVVTEPTGSWFVDAKASPGSVSEGRLEGADAVLTVADEDLGGLSRGELTAEDLYQRGRLRVDGNIRVAQRLGFLAGLQ